MRRLPLIAVLALLALPAMAQAKPTLTVARGRLAVVRYLHSEAATRQATLEGCGSPRWNVVTCNFTMIDPNNPDTTTFHDYAVARLLHGRIGVSIPDWLDEHPFSERF